MSGQRQKNQPEQGVLAFPAEGRSEAPKAAERGTETLMAKRKSESLAGTERLMEEVCELENGKQALQRVKANKGSPGVDGMTVDELPEYLKQHELEIGEQLRNGTYQPQPVRRVEIQKPDGSGVRKLGIPCVLDRFVQQAVLQVLQKRWDPTFSEHSHGFRPGRSAKQAVREAQQYIAEGHSWVVDLDLDVARPGQRKFLGFSFTSEREPRRRIAPKAITRFKENCLPGPGGARKQPTYWPCGRRATFSPMPILWRPFSVCQPLNVRLE